MPKVFLIRRYSLVKRVTDTDDDDEFNSPFETSTYAPRRTYMSNHNRSQRCSSYGELFSNEFSNIIDLYILS